MSITTIAPSHDLLLGDAAAPGGDPAFFAADGRFYVPISERSINVWNVAVFQWPEVLGALLALVLLAALVSVLRVRRRPRRAGERYCARCNYQLAGLPEAAPCPECGADLRVRRPIIGRSARRRLALPLALAVLAAAGYAGLHLARVPRANRARDVVDWSSPWLAQFARAHNIAWLKRHDEPTASLLELDPRSGRVLRRVCRVGRYSNLPISPSPDGRHAVTTLDRGELVAIDLHTGKTIRTASRPDGQLDRRMPGGPGWRSIVGWPTDQSILVQFVDPKASGGPKGVPGSPESTGPSNTVFRWDIASGDLSAIADVSAPKKAAAPHRSIVLRTLHLIPRTDPPLACEIADRYSEAAGYGQPSTIRIREMIPGGRVVREITSEFWAGCAPTPLADGSAFFIRSWRGPGIDIELWSVDGANSLGELGAPGFMGTLQRDQGGLAYHDASHRLFVATSNPDSVHVRDTAAKRWIATLPFGMQALPDNHIALSPDGRWLATYVTEAFASPPSPSLPTSSIPASMFKRHLLVFDLSPLNAPADGSGAATPDVGPKTPPE